MLKRDLRAPRPDARRRAVKGLVELGIREAWLLVFEALEDKDGQVADTAQLALAAIEEPRLLRELFGRAGLGHKEPWVRVRVAEAFGRMVAPLDCVDVARGFDRQAPEVTCALLWSLERLADAGRLTGDREDVVERVVGELSRGRAASVRATALLTLSALDAERALQTAKSLRADREPEVRIAALTVATSGARPAREGLPADRRDEWLAAAFADEDPRVRAAALRCLARAPSKAGLERAAVRLTLEPRESLRHQTLAVLRTTTGWRHGPNPAAWGASLATLPTDWDGRPVVESRAATEPGARSVAALGQLAPMSDRLAILIDFSGSLWNVRADGQTRKELLDPEFRALVGALPAEAHFNVVPYTAQPHPWQPSLVDATPRRLQEAQTAFERWTMRGQGDAYGAIQVALADPDVDRILLLTDGAPTGGHRWDLPLMIDLLLERARLRPVTFDVVLIDTPGGTVRRWERLTTETGGRLITVTFDDKGQTTKR